MLSSQVDLLFSYADAYVDHQGNQYINHDKLMSAIMDVRNSDDRGSNRCVLDVYIYMYMYVCMYVRMYVYVCTCTHELMSAIMDFAIQMIGH